MPNNYKTNKRLLDKIKESFLNEDSPSSEIIEIMTNLVGAKYEPVADFFVSCLDDSRYIWKIRALDILALNYEFNAENNKTLIKIRDLLLKDPHYSIRMKAASILATKSTWPDSALKSALISEDNKAVIIQVFQAILVLAGVPYPLVKVEIERVRNGEINAELSEIERITQNAAKQIKPN